MWLPDGEENIEDIQNDIRFDRVHECDRQSAHDGIGRAYA